jgi:hypothetical protein
VLTLLDLAAHFWQWWGLWMAAPLYGEAECEPSKKRHRRREPELIEAWRAEGIVRYYAARFVAYVEGWKQFCAGLHLDPEVQARLMIGWDNVQRTEAAARELAFDTEAAARFVRLQTVPAAGDETRERGPQPVETAEEVAKGWQAILEQILHRQGGA